MRGRTVLREQCSAQGYPCDRGAAGEPVESAGLRDAATTGSPTETGRLAGRVGSTGGFGAYAMGVCRFEEVLRGHGVSRCHSLGSDPGRGLDDENTGGR